MDKKIFDQIISDDYNSLESHLLPNSVNLSLIIPPNLEQKNSDVYHDFLKNILKKIANVTIPAGICCLFVSDEIDPKTDVMSTKTTKSLLQILGSKDEAFEWIDYDKILWVKSPKQSTDSVSHTENGVMISFDQTPFSTIHVLVKKGSNIEPTSILDRLWDLQISESKKTEMSDSIWFIQPRSEEGYKDHLPKELLIRLIMLFSKENDLVFDPFSRNGITALASKILKRRYLCLVDNEKKITLIKKRLEIY